MQALAPEAVIYAGTASKSLAPGVRLGWLVLPAALVDDVVAAKTRTDRLSSTLDQLALADLIESGGYDRQVRRCRLAYRRRRARMIAALQRAAPDLHIAGVGAGLHLLIELADAERERAAVAEAANHGLALFGLSGYSARPNEQEGGLVIGYATPPDHAFTAAVASLCAVLEGISELS
jgi:GntR family transcriptional regulator / MocR family aminotransferase